MELEQSRKDELKKQKLSELKMKYFILKMDKTACEAIGDKEEAKRIEKQMMDFEKAYQAIEVM